MSGLSHRVKRLEDTHSGATQGSDAIAERRARLAPYLADDTYFASHREAIMVALCDTSPGSAGLHYELRQTHAAGDVAEYAAQSCVFLDWSARDEGGEPTVTMFVLPTPEAPEEEGDHAG